jgi:rRNA-processing protein FCF1
MTPEILIDTNFIITCVKQKIDFFEDLKFMGFKLIIPMQVIQELEKLNRKLELKLLEKNKDNFQVVRFKRGYVDKGIIEYSKKNPRAIIATLDLDLKNKILNRIMVIRSKKKLEIV